MMRIRTSFGGVLLAGLLLLSPGAPAYGSALPAKQEAQWIWPTTRERQIVAPFRAPAHDYGPGHRGMDISAPVGTEVRAPTAGVIAFRGVVVDRAVLTLQTDDGYVVTFEPLESALAPGERVTAGLVLGRVPPGGGHAPDGSVHLGVRRDGEYINPLPLFVAPPRAILLPCC